MAKKSSILDRFGELGRKSAEMFRQNFAKKAPDIISEIDELNSALLNKNIEYLNEKNRLNQEAFSEEERIREYEYNKRLQNAKTQEDIENIKNTEILRQQKAANAKYIAELKHLESVANEQKKMIKQVYTDIAKSAISDLMELEKAQFSLQQKLENYSKPFERQTTTFVNQGYGLTDMKDGILRYEKDLVFKKTKLNDYTQDIQDLTNYRDVLLEVKNRISDQETASEFFSVLRDLSIEDGTDFANELLRTSEDGFNKYINSWKEKQKLTATIAEEFYSSDVKKVVESANQELINQFGEIPNNFWDFGKNSAENFATAFVNRMDELRAELQAAATIPIDVSMVGNAPSTNNYTTNYQFAPTDESISKQLETARNQAILDQMRGEI